ncbi:MAG: helix-turn-helix domain-containing protein [Planctomycetes bacterium]|nr:helix-turn-helix domain-containing protein [Planctomycetota bacterium]
MMDELTVRILRAVACRARLGILARLVAGGEATPTKLARDLRLRLDLVCAHLARLDGAGLVQRRRSGARCYYTAQSPYSRNTLSGDISLWLQDAFRGQPATPGRRSGASAELAAGTRHDTLAGVFDAATAFANVRRLQILRRLTGGKEADGPTLGRELRMSDAAVSRHVAKLVRRGYVQAVRRKHRLVCRAAAEAKSLLHGRLLEIVSAQWAGETLRS